MIALKASQMSSRRYWRLVIIFASDIGLFTCLFEIRCIAYFDVAILTGIFKSIIIIHD